jgi:hypothetical protein
MLIFVGLVALCALGINVGLRDVQTGSMICLYSLGVTLVWIVFDIPKHVLTGWVIGSFLGLLVYFWRLSHDEIERPDRLFEFVMYTAWFSIFGGAAGTVLRLFQTR